MIALLLASVAVGCTVKTPLPPAATLQPASTPTPTAARSPLAAPEPTTAETAGHLLARRVASPLLVDGQVDDIWATAERLRLPLTWGMDGPVRAPDVELCALYTAEAVYFLAQWPGEPPSGEDDTVFNKFTVHWRIPDADARRLDCAVACHTAFANGQGRVVHANAETIPQGGFEALSVAGSWHAGAWTVEWSRPLVNSNPFDLQFADLDRAYVFFVKVFERFEGRPDPVSARHLLVFQP